MFLAVDKAASQPRSLQATSYSGPLPADLALVSTMNLLHLSFLHLHQTNTFYLQLLLIQGSTPDL